MQYSCYVGSAILRRFIPLLYQLNDWVDKRTLAFLKNGFFSSNSSSICFQIKGKFWIWRCKFSLFSVEMRTENGYLCLCSFVIWGDLNVKPQCLVHRGYFNIGSLNFQLYRPQNQTLKQTSKQTNLQHFWILCRLFNNFCSVFISFYRKLSWLLAYKTVLITFNTQMLCLQIYW